MNKSSGSYWLMAIGLAGIFFWYLSSANEQSAGWSGPAAPPEYILGKAIKDVNFNRSLESINIERDKESDPGYTITLRFSEDADPAYVKTESWLVAHLFVKELVTMGFDPSNAGGHKINVSVAGERSATTGTGKSAISPIVLYTYNTYNDDLTYNDMRIKD